MRTTIEIRLEIIRSVRVAKLEELDYNIKLLEDMGKDTSALREHRQRLRDVTEPYKTLLKKKTIKQDDKNPILAQDWEVFTSVDWN
jgi:type VI protein secretion system component VasK